MSHFLWRPTNSQLSRTTRICIIALGPRRCLLLLSWTSRDNQPGKLYARGFEGYPVGSAVNRRPHAATHALTPPTVRSTLVPRNAQDAKNVSRVWCHSLYGLGLRLVQARRDLVIPTVPVSRLGCLRPRWDRSGHLAFRLPWFATKPYSSARVPHRDNPGIPDR